MSWEDETDAETKPPKSNSRVASPMSTDQKSLAHSSFVPRYQEYGSPKHAPSGVQFKVFKLPSVPAAGFTQLPPVSFLFSNTALIAFSVTREPQRPSLAT